VSDVELRGTAVGHALAASPGGGVVVAGTFYDQLVVGGRSMVLTAPVEYFVASFNSTGSHRWSEQISSPRFGRPVIGIHPELGDVAVAVGGMAGQIYYFGSSGKNMWHRELGLAEVFTDVAVHENQVFAVGATTDRGLVVALDGGSGEVEWTVVFRNLSGGGSPVGWVRIVDAEVLVTGKTEGDVEIETATLRLPGESKLRWFEAKLSLLGEVRKATFLERENNSSWLRDPPGDKWSLSACEDEPRLECAVRRDTDGRVLLRHQLGGIGIGWVAVDSRGRGVVAGSEWKCPEDLGGECATKGVYAAWLSNSGEVLCKYEAGTPGNDSVEGLVADTSGGVWILANLDHEFAWIGNRYVPSRDARVSLVKLGAPR
jgi:hypothetical protein